MINSNNCPYCGGTWSKSTGHGGYQEWKCSSCGYKIVVASEDDALQLYELGKFSDEIIGELHSRRGRKRAHRIEKWKEANKTYEFDAYIKKYGGNLANDPLFSMAQIANLTYGFEKYSSDDEKVKSESLYEGAKAYVKENPKAKKIKELITLYKRKLKNRSRNTGIKIIIPVVVVIAGALAALNFWQISASHSESGIKMTVPHDSISMFDKFGVSIQAEKQPSNSVAYIDTKNALRNETEKFVLYDLSLNSGSGKADLKGEVTVTVPIPKGYDTSCLKVYYISSDEQYEEIPSTVSVAQNTITFKTEHFSLYAIAERHPIVTFDPAGGNEVDRQIVKRDTLAKSPEDPTKKGYEFEGWTYEGKDWDFSTDTVKKDIVLVAKWKIKSYNVNLELDGGQSNVTSLNVTYMGTYKGLPTPVKTGYTFKGWYTAKEQGTKVEETTVMELDGDVTLYARYEKKSNAVIFNANGGEGSMKDFVIGYEESAKLPKNSFEKVGYTFLGWSTTITGDVVYADEAQYTMGPNESYSLYAQWEININTVKFNSNGGDGEMADISMSYGSTQRLPDVTISRVGYEFLGWSTTPSGDVKYIDGAEYTMGVKSEYILYAQWKKKVNIVRFDANGGQGSMDHIRLEYGQIEALPMCGFYRDGYVFIGWSDMPMGENLYADGAEYKMGAEEETRLYALWAGAENRFIFDSNGGEGSMPTDFTINTGEVGVLPANQFTRDGYTFVGWATDPAGLLKYADGAEYSLERSGEVILYAKWETINYTITFNSNGGNTIPEKSYNVESPDIYFTIPTKVGYTFDGWYENEEFTGHPTDAVYMGTYGNKTFWARWSLIEYTITFDSVDGDFVQDISYNIESDTIKFPTPTKRGYSFEGWYGAGEVLWTEMPGGSHENAEFYAKWLPVEYTVGFESNLGSAVADMNFTIENTTFKLPIPTRDGYAFDGWYDTPDMSENVYDRIYAGTVGNIKLYAKWIPVTYTVIFDSVGGEPLDNITYTIEDKTIKLPKAEKTGYEFVRWHDADGNAVSEITNGTFGDIELFAEWKLISYKLTFDLGGGTIPEGEEMPQGYDYESKVVFPIPSKQGFTFGGWYDSPLYDGSIITQVLPNTTGDIKVYAQWIPDTYTVTFNENGGEDVEEVTYTSVSATFSLPIPSRIGYAFGGWYTTQAFEGDPISQIERGSCRGDETLYAKWLAESYTVTFVVNGGTALDPLVYTIESQEVVLPNAVRENYVFVGWYSDPLFEGERIHRIQNGSMGNKTFYAKWSTQAYTITFDANGGEDVPPVKYTAEDATFPLPSAKRNGYEFLGWYSSPDMNGESITHILNGSSGDMLLYAKWSMETYTVDFYTNLGDAPSSITYDVTSSTFNLPTLSVEGYDFIGWSLHSDLSGDIIHQIQKGSYGDKELYAKFEAIRYPVIYMTNGGNALSAGSYTKEDSLTLPIPSRDGYDFVAWYDNELFEGEAVTIIGRGNMGEKKFYARWSDPIEYKVEYNLYNGELPEGAASTLIYTVESEAITLPVPAKEGYDFGGWYTNSSYSGSQISAISKGSVGDIKLYAKWTPIEYNLTFILDGEEYQNTTYTVESGYKSFPLPEITGHTFSSGWHDNAALDGASVNILEAGNIGDRTFYGKMTANKYKATYNLNSASIKNPPTVSATSKDVVYGTSFALSVPTAEHYIFQGWYTAASGGVKVADADGKSVSNWSIAQDTTLYAQWKQQYTYALYISTPDEFKMIGTDATDKLTGKKYSMSQHYMLIRDIYLGSDWTPIGTYKWTHRDSDDFSYISNPFTGTLDGLGHWLTFNSVVDVGDNAGKDAAWGLFGTAKNARFLNLNITATIKGLPENTIDECSVGALVGEADNVWFSWCMLSGSSSMYNKPNKSEGGTVFAGGLVGDARSCEFVHCSNYASVEAHGFSAYAGGIVGNGYQSTFTDCINGGAINASHMTWLFGGHGFGDIYGTQTAP